MASQQMVRRVRKKENKEEVCVKRMKEIKEEVCIVLHPCYDSEYQYYIYIVDLSKLVDPKEVEVEGPKIPSVRLGDGLPFDMAFAVKDSNLYMFGGSPGDIYPEWSKASFTYRFPSPGTHSHIESIKDDGVTPISPMNFFKHCPRAVLIGDRICVFSMRLEPDFDEFELYDPDSDRWWTAPKIPIDYSNCKGLKQVEVIYFYVEGRQLFVKLYNGAYCIDFASTEPEWEEASDCLPEVERDKITYACVKDGGLLFSPSLQLAGAKKERKQFVTDLTVRPRKEKEKKHLFPRYRAAMQLAKEGSERLRACLVETGSFSKAERTFENEPAIAIHLLTFDAHANPTILKSHLFQLDPSIDACYIQILGIFPISNTAR